MKLKSVKSNALEVVLRETLKDAVKNVVKDAFEHCLEVQKARVA